MQMSSSSAPKYWFRAKRYGWGWGPPCAWQGWAVLITHLVLVFGGIPFIQVPLGSLPYIGFVGVLTLVLIAICWLKGPPPRWRWGEGDA